MTSRFAPLLSFRGGTVAAAGAEDGTLVFFDMERSGSGKCVVNKLLGHSKPVIALSFSHDEAFVASADTSGQVIVWKK